MSIDCTLNRMKRICALVKKHDVPVMDKITVNDIEAAFLEIYNFKIETVRQRRENTHVKPFTSIKLYNSTLWICETS